MIDSLNQKLVVLAEPQAAVDDASVTVAALDTEGFAHVDIYLILGATDIALTALDLTESDASGSGFAAIAGADFNGGTLGDGTTAALPTSTSDNEIFAFHVNCTGGRKRYIKPAVAIGNGSVGAYVTVLAILSRAQQTPFTAADRGLQAEIYV